MPRHEPESTLDSLAWGTPYGVKVVYTEPAELPKIPKKQHRWLNQGYSQVSECNHSYLESLSLWVIDKYRLRDAHPGRIPPTPRTTLLLLVLFVRRLLAHEPDIIQLVVWFLEPHQRESPILLPIRTLYTSLYGDLWRFVAGLPEEWQEYTTPRKVVYLYEMLSDELLTMIRECLVCPDPHVSTIKIEYNGNWLSYKNVLYHVPDGVYPLPVQLTSQRRFVRFPLLRNKWADYYMRADSRIRGSIVSYFHEEMARAGMEGGMPETLAVQMGTLLFGATTLRLSSHLKTQSAWMKAKADMERYKQIKKTHCKKKK